jgi:hypothetical protein
MDASTRRFRRPAPPTTIGWRLDDLERTALLKRFPPLYPDVVADHVTLKMGARPRDIAPEPCSGLIVGEADDGAGLQCLVVQVEGVTVRPDGGIYHVTWSLHRGRRPIESNGVIAWLGWRAVEPALITLIPARF